jgi:hypothetical protein
MRAMNRLAVTTPDCKFTKQETATSRPDTHRHKSLFARSTG